DASVVRHDVETILTMNGRVDRADRFTGCVLAMLTRHRLMNHFRILRPNATVLVNWFPRGVITIDAQPVHDPAVRDLQLAYNGNVVLRLAGDHTRTASAANIQIDGHSPLLRGTKRRMRVDSRRPLH